MERSKDFILALMGGLLLALMIDTNSLLAMHSTPIFASWFAHGVGTFAAIAFLIMINGKRQKPTKKSQTRKKAPLWSYLGGVAGALVVALGAITVNSPLGLSGAISLMLLGQIIFGMISDHFGLFGVVKKKVVTTDFIVVLCVFTGSGILIIKG